MSSLFFVLICLTSLSQIKTEICRKEVGYCDVQTGKLNCYIEANNTEGIKDMVKDCIKETERTLYLDKSYVSNAFGNLVIDIELPSNIQVLYLQNSHDHDYFRLTTSQQNSGLTSITAYAHIELESNDFFNYFTGLRSLPMSNIISKESPSFTNLQYLTYLRAKIQMTSPQAIDRTVVRGLSKLIALDLRNSNFNGVTEGAFDGVIKLTRLFLNYNEIKYIEDGALNELSSLKQLYLYNNGIKTVTNNVFKGLTKLITLDIGNNPGFPIQALLQTRNLQSLFMQYNGYTTLEPYVFQQMKELRNLYLRNPFTCDCRIQWISLALQYGLYTESAYCSAPFNVIYKPIITPQLYTSCTQTQSYECFNKSITCRSNEVCIDAKDGYFCGCPKGYSLYSSGECKDIDECNEANNCQHYCVNTEGTFHCACNEGYKLSVNGYDCEDINECQEWNGGCEFGCRNSIGSYQCYCEYGHELYNGTNCNSEIQCEQVGSSYSQESYTEELGDIIECKGGFNLSITNLTCINAVTNVGVQTGQFVKTTLVWPISTTALLVVTIFIIVVQAILIVLVVIYFKCKLNRNVSNPIPPKDQQNKLECSEDQQKYNKMDEAADSNQLPATGYDQRTNKRYFTLPSTEPYPAGPQDDMDN